MKKLFASGKFFCLMATLLFAVTACTKNLSTSTSATSTPVTTSTSSTIAVAVDSAGTTDSIYVIQPCARGYFRDSLVASALSSAITSYLDSAYSGYSFLKGYVIKDSAGTVGGYVVIISYNGKPVALLFNASGVLVRVLEQREAGDIDGDGWHHGGRFGNRDGLHHDTTSLSALPASITSYYSSNYPQDTLLKAFRNSDSGYVVISKDSGLIYATVFSSTGSFVKRTILAAPDGQLAAIDQGTLPSSVLSYLTTTYPDYVFERAYSLTADGSIRAYLVVIDANNTKYGLIFDSSGTLLSAQTIW
jgi:hypothetical protein